MGRYAIDTKYTAWKSGTNKDSNSWLSSKENLSRQQTEWGDTVIDTKYTDGKSGTDVDRKEQRVLLEGKHQQTTD